MVFRILNSLRYLSRFISLFRSQCCWNWLKMTHRKKNWHFLFSIWTKFALNFCCCYQFSDHIQYRHRCGLLTENTIFHIFAVQCKHSNIVSCSIARTNELAIKLLEILAFAFWRKVKIAYFSNDFSIVRQPFEFTLKLRHIVIEVLTQSLWQRICMFELLKITYEWSYEWSNPLKEMHSKCVIWTWYWNETQSKSKSDFNSSFKSLCQNGSNGAHTTRCIRFRNIKAARERINRHKNQSARQFSFVI